MTQKHSTKSPSKTSGASATLHLRLLETTDVHANLLPYDYFTNRPVADYGLARTATLIQAARAEHKNVLLFDNGDYLQGTPLSDLAAAAATPRNTIKHPVITAMNALNYDAATVGNHEFNFGLDLLQRCLRSATFPVICANLLHIDGPGQLSPLFPPYLILKRELHDSTGAVHHLKIGVIGLTPPQATTWDQYHLQGRVESRDMIETAEQVIRDARAAGADLIVALAHTGIGPANPAPMSENVALALGALPGLDAILAGHTHEVFPSAQITPAPGIDAARGRLNGTPAVMAGARGSHLGVIDLELTKSDGGAWQVTNAQSEARPLGQDTPASPDMTRLLSAAHAKTLSLTSVPLGHTARPLHSYLALVQPCAATRLVTRAKRMAAQRLVAGTDDAVYPILSASASFKTGGRAGPNHYTDVPPGPLCLRHAADLYSFPNVLCMLRLTGADLRDWLERAAIVFEQVTPGQTCQRLLNPDVPGHHFDMIDGLSYEIDLSQPPRYDLMGQLISDKARRIHGLTYQGAPLRDDQTFVLATNNYRAFGGGPFRTARPEQVVHTSTRILRDIVADYIREMGAEADSLWQEEAQWHFTSMPNTTVYFDTGPGLRSYPEEIAALPARDMGDSPNGFARLELDLR